MINKKLTIISLSIIVAMLISCTDQPPAVNPFEISLDTVNGGIGDVESNVSLTPIFVLKFTKPMDLSTIDTKNILFYKLEDNIPIKITAIESNSEHTKFYFAPESKLLAFESYYTIEVINVKDKAGDVYPYTKLFGFSTGESVVPMVAIITPDNHASQIKTSNKVQVMFSAKVNNIESNTFTLKTQNPEATIAGTILPESNNIYTFTPNVLLESNTQFFVHLTNGITNDEGVPLKDITFDFTTSAESVVMLNPIDNTENVSLQSKIIIKFNELVTRTDDLFTVHQGSEVGPILQGTIIKNNENEYVFTPTLMLNYNTIYYVVINNSLIAVSEKNINKKIIYSFKTIKN